DALGELRARGHTDVEAHFAGAWPPGVSEAAFRDRLDVLGIADSTHVLGPVQDRTRIRRLLEDADAFVLPTYYPVEAQPFAIIEAMNAATPIVATSHASIPDYVHSGANGFLVGKQAPGEIADALE